MRLNRFAETSRIYYECGRHGDAGGLADRLPAVEVVADAPPESESPSAR
jgi:hypothetical protein